MEGEVKRPPEGLDPTGGILDYDSASEPDMVMAHVLFMDVVRYSSYAMDEQAQLLTKLNKIVRSTPEFSRAEAASTLRPLPTGDGMALAFLGSLEEAVRCAIAVSRALQEHPDLELRMGIHTGGVLNAKDITGKDNIAGPGINLAQRVMDCGDAGHILVSGYVAETLSQLTRWRDMLHELGETTVKNTKVRVFNFHGPAFGNPEVPSRFRIPEGSAKTRKKVAILYKRNAQPDEYVLKVLEKELAAAGHDVFIDRHLKVGSEWANVIEEHVRLADAVVVLVSTHSILSEMMAFELGTARQAAERAPNERRGLPRILPVRVAYEGYLPDEINAIIGKLQYVLWHGPQDDELLVKELHRAISSIGEAFDPYMLPEASVKPHDPTKAVVSGPQTGREPTEWHGPLTGAIPIALDRWYVKRRTDDEFLAAVKRRDSILLIKGPRQAGKTSLMVRGIARAREENWRIITTDFQKLNASDLVSTEALFRALTADIIDDLDLDLNPDDVWTGRRGPSVTFERFLRREVLEPMPMPLIWCIDEVDRMFGCDFGSEVFGLFRSWHNERALDPTGPWSRLTLVIGYATEAHLFISDLNQSPFNVGTTFELQDFTTEQISELNDRYGNPLKNLSEVTAMHTLVHGHPYLVQRCLYEMASQNIGMTDLEEIADRDNGPLSDHLKRLLMLLAQDSEMREVIKGVLRGEPCPTPESFYRLRSAGLLVGDSARDARMRGRLYANYLERHLLSRAN